MSYLDRLRNLQKVPAEATDKPDKSPPSVGFVGTHVRPFPENDARLVRLHESFDLVTRAFQCRPDELQLAWAIALRDIGAAEAALHSDAAMIRAGWTPLEQRGTALKWSNSTGAAAESRAAADAL